MRQTLLVLLLLLFPLAVRLVTGQFLPQIGVITVPGQPVNEKRLFCQVTTGTGVIQPLTFYLNDTDVLDLLTYNEVRFDDSGGRRTIIFQLTQELEGVYTCGNDTAYRSNNSFTLVSLPSQDDTIDLHYAVPVGGMTSIECGIKQGALGEFYSPRWIRDGSREIDVDTVGSRFQINRRILEDFTLIISPVVLEDNGTYICSVDVMIDGQLHTVESPEVTLTVHVTPTPTSTSVPAVMSTSEQPSSTPATDSSPSSIVAVAAGVGGSVVAAFVLAIVIFVVVCCCCIQRNNDPEVKGIRRYTWRARERGDNGTEQIQLTELHVSPSKHFHSKGTPEFHRQIGRPCGSQVTLDPYGNPVYNGGSMISATSGMSMFTSDDEEPSCPPSPAVSSYQGEEDPCNKLPYGPSISIDDQEVFTTSGYGDRARYPQQQFEHSYNEEGRPSAHYPPSQTSSFGVHNLFEGRYDREYSNHTNLPPSHQHHASCDPTHSLGVPMPEYRAGGSTPSVRSDRTHSSRGSSKSDKFSHLMHQENCQIQNCPCKQVKKRFKHILPQTHIHQQEEANKMKEVQSGNFDRRDRRQQLRLGLSSQQFNKNIHPHYHMTSHSHIRQSKGSQRFIQRRRSKSMDLTPVMEQPKSFVTTPVIIVPDSARGLLCGPAIFSPAVTPSGEKLRVLSPTTPSSSSIAPPVLLREISLSADNLPSLCLNDSPSSDKGHTSTHSSGGLGKTEATSVFDDSVLPRRNCNAHELPEFCEEEKKICYTGEEKVFDDLWDSAGIKIYFPRASLDKSIEVSVKIVTDIGGMFMPEEQSSTAVEGKPKKWFTPITQTSEGFMPIVSAIYKITASGKLPLPITLQVRHCAVIGNESSLRFIVSRDERPPYRFMQLDHGEFSANVGKIEMSEFSRLAILYDALGWYIKLSLQVFHFPYDAQDQTATVKFAVTKNIPTHVNAVKTEYSKATNIHAKTMSCENQTEAITLSVSPEDDSESNAWYSVAPVFEPPTVSVDDIIDYEPEKIIPHVELAVTWTDKGVDENKEVNSKIQIEGGSRVNTSFSLKCRPLVSPQYRSKETSSQAFNFPAVASPKALSWDKSLSLLPPRNIETGAHDTHDATTGRTGKLDINEDSLSVKMCLEHLDKSELRDLFRDLGLSEQSVGNRFSDSGKADYLHDLIRMWILEKDDVLKRGGAMWEHLQRSLNRRKHFGIAKKIRHVTYTYC